MLLIPNNGIRKKREKKFDQVRQIFSIFLQLNLCNFRLKQWKGLTVIKHVKQITFEGVWVELESKKLCRENQLQYI